MGAPVLAVVSLVALIGGGAAGLLALLVVIVGLVALALCFWAEQRSRTLRIEVSDDVDGGEKGRLLAGVDVDHVDHTRRRGL
ncbi:hypothetical protein KFE25_009688 [Diacronema lutheri]|uniref:Uncharacterized protein n=2 Tax=Diacronema lutheri TaxID=2081491 RepID=A0A8J5XYP0_DIALT|nr:hypothetical protein KFE25_009688 [Diacronema lutheri]